MSRESRFFLDVGVFALGVIVALHWAGSFGLANGREPAAEAAKAEAQAAAAEKPVDTEADGEDDEPDADEPDDQVVDTDPADRLSLQQQAIADKYQHLEEVLLRMAELTASTDPRRAALLRRAVAQSKERLVGVQFETLVELLGKDQLSRAVENQESLDVDLRALLELLLSEDRSRRLESEKARVRGYLKEVNRIIKQQKSIQGRTPSAGDPGRLAEEQGSLSEDTGNLAGKIREHEEDSAPGQAGEGEAEDGEGESGEGESGEGESGEGESGEGESGEGESGEGESGEGESGEGESGEGESGEGESGEGKSGEGESGEGKSGEGESGEGESGEGESGEGESGEGQSGEGGGQQEQSQQANPARQRLEAAQQRMREAEEKLEQAEREGAVEKQEEAIRELEKAKAELEEILRQLREEEIEQILAMLEARFKRMLQMQREVYVGTQRLDDASEEALTHDQEIQAARLSAREAEIVLEADKALALLREEGSTIAFPEAVDQVREDMRQVVERLARARTGEITQAIEEDIIAALEEMIEALEKSMEDAEERRQEQNPPPSQPQDPALVDLIAELKMIRALQMRINKRTERYSKLIIDQQADNQELLEALRRLAEREERIYEITRELGLGRNR